MSEQKRINRGLAWIGVASSLVGLLDFLAILIILNTWITKTEYGIATECIWIFPILDQATDLGLSAAVIQRDDHDDTKISTVFWINFGIALAMFGAMCLVGPLVGKIYGYPIIGSMLIVYGTKLIWQNLYFIPQAMMKRELRFGELSVIRIIANLAEFAGKVGFAAAGFGIWCFVLGPMCRVFVTGIGSQICHPWRPKLRFAWAGARDYVTFGAKTSGSQILFYFYTNIDYAIVGYYFGATALGIYRMAYEIVLEPVRMISNVVVDVAFPAFAKLRHMRDKVIEQFVSFVRLNLVTVMTYSAIVFVSAADVVTVIFPKYQGAAPAVRILCAVAVLRAVSFVIPPLLDGLGKPNRTFIYTLVAAVTLPLCYNLFAIFLGDRLDFLSVAVAWAVGYPVAFAVLILLAIYTLEWSPTAFLRAVLGIPLCTIAAAAAGFGVRELLPHATPALRLGLVTATILAVVLLLLAYTQGLSIAGALRAMKGDKPAPTPEAPADGAQIEPPS
ncbi:MAG TPA: lipopolysaccharide biosynthesis protein [Kofleriaceae bacterium]|jgi:O-antigen/teichoic acid export membrane protein